VLLHIDIFIMGIKIGIEIGMNFNGVGKIKIGIIFQMAIEIG